MNRVPSFIQFNHLEQNLLHQLRAEIFNVSINPSEDDVNSGDTVAPVQNLPILSRNNLNYIFIYFFIFKYEKTSTRNLRKTRSQTRL